MFELRIESGILMCIFDNFIVCNVWYCGWNSLFDVYMDVVSDLDTIEVSLIGTIKPSLSLLCISMIWENMDLEIWPYSILMNHSLHHSDVLEYIFNENVYYNMQQQRYSSHIKMFHFKQLQCLYFLHALKSVLTLLTESENRIKNIIFPLSVWLKTSIVFNAVRLRV